MANIESLHGSDKLREAYPKVNKNFNAIDKEVTDLRSRVNNIITTPIDGQAAAQEVVDARNSAAKSKIFDTLDARLEEIEQDNASVAQELDAHKAEKAPHPNIPVAYVGLTVNQSIPNDISTKILFDTVVTDTDNMFDANSARLICKTPGWYCVILNISFGNNSSGMRNFRITRNGGIIASCIKQAMEFSDNAISTLVPLNSNDYIEAAVYQNSGGALDVSVITKLQMYRVV